MEDIYPNILSNIDSGSLFKAARLVSIRWRNITQYLFPDGHLRFANHLRTICVKVFEYNETHTPKIQLDFEALSVHPSITYDFIQKYSQPWNLAVFAHGPNMTDELVEVWLKMKETLDTMVKEYKGFFGSTGALYGEDTLDVGELYRKHLCRDNRYQSCRLSMESMLKLGLNHFDDQAIPNITPELIAKYHLSDEIIARYGDDEIILQMGLTSHPALNKNDRISPELAFRFCSIDTCGDKIQDHFIRLVEEKKVFYKIQPDALFFALTDVCETSTKLGRLYQHTNVKKEVVLKTPDCVMQEIAKVTAEAPITNFPDFSFYQKALENLSEEDQPRQLLWAQDWSCLSCEIHRYLKSPCLKCSTLEELNAQKDYLTQMDYHTILENNKNASVFLMSVDDYPHYHQVAPFEMIKGMSTREDYSSNMNVPIQYVIEHCRYGRHLYSRPDLTWDIIARDLNAHWINWTSLCRDIR